MHAVMLTCVTYSERLRIERMSPLRCSFYGEVFIQAQDQTLMPYLHAQPITGLPSTGSMRSRAYMQQAALHSCQLQVDGQHC